MSFPRRRESTNVIPAQAGIQNSNDEYGMMNAESLPQATPRRHVPKSDSHRKIGRCPPCGVRFNQNFSSTR
jgi:hypothetical protein